MNAKCLRKCTDILAFWGKVFTKLHMFFFSIPIFKIKNWFVLYYLNCKYGAFIDGLLVRTFDMPLSDNPIWVCWLQGEKTAPELVKRCIESIRANAGNHVVNFITEDNVSKFVHIPDTISQNVRMGILSRTSYSDIVRSFLLAEYGGIWIDATFFITQPLPEYFFTYPVFSAAKQPEPKDRRAVCISEFRWTGSFIGTNVRNYALFMFLRDFFVEYTQNEEVFIDYLLIDYLIYIAYSRCEKIRTDIIGIPDNNKDFGWLFHVMNKPFNKKEAEKMFSGETFVYKLSHKKKWKESIMGKESYYGAFVSGKCQDIVDYMQK